MTLFMIKLGFSQRCDWCEEMVDAGEMAWYNPYTKRIYHEGRDCQEKAEGI